MTEDSRIAAARRRAQRAARADDGDPEDRAERGAAEAGQVSLQLGAIVESAIQQAIRRGDFDNLPGAGKPIPGLGDHHDPDWWIRRKIQTEQLHGLGPAALTLRVEDAGLSDRLDELSSEHQVREMLHDFNRRVIEARRQLLGGPPVVTPTRDIEGEVAAWRVRREQRAARQTPPEAEPARSRPRPRRTDRPRRT
ncbi:DUF1992 domain-containing protein [Microbacterium sp.]|uniref:DnaJ family domain-containing protein n=1 Tax=Microbacterium sp. TaxID=51671 RepID=UPI0039E70919